MLENQKDVDKNNKGSGLSQWELMYRKFKRNHLAIVGFVFLIFMYGSAIFAGFFSPYALETAHTSYAKAPPQIPKFIDAKGNFHIRPFIFGIKSEFNPKNYQKIYKLNKEEKYPIYLFIRGDEYELFNLFETNIHLFGVESPGKLFLLGTDVTGKDIFTGIFHGARVSLTVGLIGVILSILIGTFLGIASGYWGGMLDDFVQRTIEVMLCFPRIPLWMALSAALPPDWSSIKVFFGITIVLSFVSWGGLARQLRGKVLSMRDEGFIEAAKAAGASSQWIIYRHLLPNSLSHILVVATLSIPGMILGETMLSFLGLGIRPPMTSWGVLLNKAQHTRVLLETPWMVTPAFFVIITILSFNFVGDGIRDAADPYST